ncbi:hypothetical protein ACK8P5_00910 [Paenibacillus sp. EC2-1]|uniref:hypothetical protein n=1 Tax=Paenibacillus sp. EC2-1 TaxID=3388665 RepID=UPI003BEEC704
METVFIDCQSVKNVREAKGVIMENLRLLKSPCFVDLNTVDGKRHYYAEKSNIGLQGAGWIVVERKT